MQESRENSVQPKTRNKTAKPCRHISCIGLGKLATKLADMRPAKEPFICMICLSSVPESQMPTHCQTNNHPIFTSKDAEPPCFFCCRCNVKLDIADQGHKNQAILEKASALIASRLSGSFVPAPDAVPAEAQRPDIPTGLINLGNTCFLNSAMQALAASVVSMPQSVELDRSGPITDALIDLLRSLADDSRLIRKKPLTRASRAMDPGPFFKAWGKRHPEYRRLHQQDAHDFMRTLFNTLDEEGSSLPKSLFGGTLISRVKCLVCRNNTNTSECFLDISLSLAPPHISGRLGKLSLKPEEEATTSSSESDLESDLESGQVTDLTGCLNFWAQPSSLCKENAFACEHCPKHSDRDDTHPFVLQPAVKQYFIKKLPPVLILHLQRFKVTSVGRKRVQLSKDHQSMSIPHRLDMRPYLINPATAAATATTATTDSSRIYELTAMIIHEGSAVDSGHYVSLIRRQADWYLADDASVKPVSIEHLYRYNPYILFYTESKSS